MVRQATSDELIKILKEWQTLEDETINLADDLLAKSQNPFIKVTAEIIQRDSEKHKAMLQFALDSLTKESVRLTPQDLIPIADVLEKHLKAEAKSMGLANQAMMKNKDTFAGFILSFLMADEVKHHDLLSRIDQMKGAVYEYGQSRAERVRAGVD